MKQLLSYIIDNILENAENTEVKEEEKEGFINLEIIAPKDQVGKIIGKNGKTINSIKNILKIKAIKEGKRINIQVSEKS